MIYNRAAYRYAKATLNSCFEENIEIEAIYQDMKNVSNAFKSSKELKLFVDSKVMTKNRRIDLFDDVASSFVVLYNDHVQNQEVILTSSSLLYTSTIKEIERKVRDITNKNITLVNKIDPSIVGGFILRTGDIQYDASFKNQLNKLKQDFINISIQ